MITHKIKLYGYTAELVGESQLVLGTVDSYGIEHIEIEIGGIWSGLVLFATFHYSGTATKMAVDSNGIVEVPPQATQSGNSVSTRGKIVFQAVSETQQAISTDIEYRVYQHSDVDGNEPLPPDTSWNQIIAQAGAARDEAIQAASEAKKSLEEIGDSVERAEAAANRAERVAGDVTSAGSAEIEKIKKAGTDEVNRVKSEGDVQVQRISEEGNAASGYAEQAKKYAEEAAGYVSDVSDAANQAVSDINASKQTAITQIGSAGSEQISNVQSAGNAVVETIESEKNVAVQAVKDAQTTGVNAVQTAQTEGVKVVQTAQTEGVKAVNDAGDAKIEQIEQINSLLPKPTEADAGKVPVAQPDGSYQLGDAGSEIDDTVVAPDTTWSSLNIVNKLCPPFSVTGDAVQFSPVEGYPLSVQSTIVATQDGTGDPSPENVRPIVPVEQVGVWVGGKNLLKNKGDKTIRGISWKFDDAGLLSISGEIVNNFSDYYFFGSNEENAEAFTTDVDMVMSSNYVTNNNNNIFGARTSEGLIQNGGKNGSFIIPSGVRVYGIFMRVLNAVANYSGIYAQLELGTSATAYEPYRGQLYTAQLDEPCYGGEIDLTGGTGKATAKAVTFDGSESGWVGPTAQSNGVYYITIPVESVPNAGVSAAIACSSRTLTTMASGNIPAGCVKTSCGAVYYSSEKSTKAEILAEIQESPFTLVFSAESPTPFTIDPLAIPAPASPATAYSTAGEITVAGRSDPIEYINQQIANAVAIAKV